MVETGESEWRCLVCCQDFTLSLHPMMCMHILIRLSDTRVVEGAVVHVYMYIVRSVDIEF